MARARAHAQEDLALSFGEPQQFAPDMVREQARALAAEAFGAFDGTVPEVLANLNYDQHRDIRFRREAALWHGAGIDAEVQFFHLGYRFRTPVHVYEVAEGMAREVLYTPASFDFGDNTFAPDFPADLGFAGLRLHAPLAPQNARKSRGKPQ